MLISTTNFLTPRPKSFVIPIATNVLLSECGAAAELWRMSLLVLWSTLVRMPLPYKSLNVLDISSFLLLCTSLFSKREHAMAPWRRALPISHSAIANTPRLWAHVAAGRRDYFLSLVAKFSRHPSIMGRQGSGLWISLLLLVNHQCIWGLTLSFFSPWIACVVGPKSFSYAGKWVSSYTLYLFILIQVPGWRHKLSLPALRGAQW